MFALYHSMLSNIFPNVEKTTKIPISRIVKKIDVAFVDLIQGEGFGSEVFLLPGIPRIRPVLILLSAHATQKKQVSEQDLEHLILTIELLWAAVLVHDLTLGKPGGRRRRVARRLIGGAVGWIGGNSLNIRSMELAQQVSSSFILSELIQVMRDVSESRKDIRGNLTCFLSVQEVTEHFEQHMGAIFAFACRAGCHIAGGNDRDVTLLGRYGLHLGIVWQLQEELQYINHDLEHFIEDAMARNRPLLSLALLLEYDSSFRVYLQEYIQDFHSYDDEDESSLLQPSRRVFFEQLKQGLRKHSILLLMRTRIAQSVFRAQKALRELPQSTERQSLEDLLKSMVEFH